MKDEYAKILEIIYENKTVHKAYNRCGKLMIGMYYDDPNAVKELARMRAIVGFAFKPNSEDEREYIVDQMQRLKFKYKQLPQTRCLYSEFLLKFPTVVAYATAPAQFYREAEENIRKRKK